MTKQFLETPGISEQLRQELLISETERKMIHGSELFGVDAWREKPLQEKPLTGPRREGLLGFGTNYSALEMRTAAALDDQRTVMMYPRSFGKTSYMHTVLRHLKELGRPPVITDQEMSFCELAKYVKQNGVSITGRTVGATSRFPYNLILRHTRGSARSTLKDYAMRDIASSIALYNMHSFGDLVSVVYVAQRFVRRPDRHLVLNFDQLYGGEK